MGSKSSGLSVGLWVAGFVVCCTRLVAHGICVILARWSVNCFGAVLRDDACIDSRFGVSSAFAGRYARPNISSVGPTRYSVRSTRSSVRSTPDAVVLSGQWDAGLQMAVLNWTESSNANLQSYVVRYSPPPYDTSNDETVNTFGPGVLTANTNHGLVTPGDTAEYKVYVTLTTGNEAGSNTVSITRP